MKSAQTIRFIKGTFTPAEAKDLLFDLISNKINFHSMKNFSSQERFGKPVKDSQKRIEALKASREKFKVLIENALKHESKLEIESNIKITLKK